MANISKVEWPSGYGAAFRQNAEYRSGKPRGFESHLHHFGSVMSRMFLQSTETFQSKEDGIVV